ncbi:MAG: peptidase M48, partial [Acidobacteria bacterium]
MAITAALLTFSYVTPFSFSQDDKDSASPAEPSATTPAKKPIQAADPDKVKHEGGRTDVEAVGNRNVGCSKGLGNWYSVEKQIAMGKQYSQQIESTVKLVQDPVVTEYVNRLGQNLVRNSDSQVPFTIK